MRENFFRKSLVLGIIFLFVGISIIPMYASNTNKQFIINDNSELITNQIKSENFTLTINILGDGNGIVNITPPGIEIEKPNGKINIARRLTVKLFAKSDYGSEFVRWSGDLTGIGRDNPRDLLMDSNKTVNLTFELEEYPNFLGRLNDTWEITAYILENPEVYAYWRNDNHYFFKKTSENTAIGNFSVICYVKFDVPSPAGIFDRCARFEIILKDPVDNHIINEPYQWSVNNVKNGEERIESRRIEEFKFDFNTLHMQPGQNEKTLEVLFHGWGYINLFGKIPGFDYIDWLWTFRSDNYVVSQEISVHFE